MAESHRIRPTAGRIVVVLLGVLALLGCTQSPAPPVGATAPPTAGEVSAFLAELAAATDDPAHWAGLIDPADSDFIDDATRLRDNLAPFDVDFTPAGRIQPLTPDRAAHLAGSARAHAVRVRWSVPGEPSPAEHLVWLTLTNTPHGPRLAGTTDGPATTSASPIWWSTPTQVYRSDRVVVIAAGHTDPDPWVDGLRTAAAVLARHGLHRDLFIAEIPATATEFERVLGVPQGSHRRVAAAAWPFGPAVRIVVNPEAGGATRGAARQVLLTHEAVHAASGSVRRPIPLWLAEGYADMVALSEQPEVGASHLAHLADDQRRHGPATALVTDAELGPNHPRVDANYQRAWVTARVLDQGRGVAGRVHAEVLAGAPLDRALAAEGWTEAGLAAAVTAELRRLVG